MPIRWTPPAARDLTQIADYIQEKDGPAPARRVALAIHEAVSRLSRFPQLGRAGQESGHSRTGHRRPAVSGGLIAFMKTWWNCCESCMARNAGRDRYIAVTGMCPSAVC